MRAPQQIFRIRREYNIWVGNQTLEDYALRFTAKTARRWTIERVALTALGATAFLALEALAASITLSYGFTNAMAAILTVAAVIFVTGFPITYYAAKHGLDIDLLTRGAGFGYLGSTLTSLIYASFTFIFFAIEAAILASALQALLGIPLAVGYVLCALAVVPIVTHGITAISKFQIGTQGFWLTLQVIALVLVGFNEVSQIDDWSRYAPANLPGGNELNLVHFGACSAILFAMMAQIGEQVDYLRFMPPKTPENARRWWFWLVMAGPGWIFIGIVKMALGSFLAYLLITRGAPVEQAIDPTYMYQTVFNYLTHSPGMSLVLAGSMVIVSQMKINVTNAYAGSIAWSNFFSRLTHSHPGRVVWLVFNVAIALILMELGIYRALEAILGVFAIVAVSWLGCLSADLMINKPLGLSPGFVEFKRAHLYDVNPVGLVSMVLASAIGIFSYLGSFGEVARHLSHYVSLGLCFVFVPFIAWLTKGRFYLARQSPELEVPQQQWPIEVEPGGVIARASFSADEARSRPQTAERQTALLCCICENNFEREDMSFCPAYQGPICSLCCSLDSRCLDSCKPGARFSEQLQSFLRPLLPESVMRIASSRLAQFVGIFGTVNVMIAVLLALIYYQMQPQAPSEVMLLKQTLITVFFIFLIVSGVVAWLYLLAHESRIVAQQESQRQTLRLIREIEAHRETDLQLQRAKEQAERANSAKSRYLTGISHELRTPLQAILGYAQILTRRQDMPPQHHNALQTIRRSGEHLADLIEGLLDISKIEAGRLDIYRNHVNLPDLIQQLELMFREQAAEKGIRFTCHVHNRLPEQVVTDEKRLRQILINLLSNAIKYTEKGSVDFHIRYRNQVAEFSVLDTGVGINENDMQRILDPFERVRSPDVPNVQGTGLGLTIVKLLTEIMGGELKISSTPGVGSNFTVTLMFSYIANPATAAFPSRMISGYEGRRRTVLVVDDEPIHRGLMFDLLNPLGFTTIEARDARSCLDVLREVQPDIFLLDVSMPGIDGLQLAAGLREQGYTAPIVMISADAQEHHRHPQQKANHDDYMVKPINNQKLVERIGQLLALEWRYSDMPESTRKPVTSSPVIDRLPDHPLLRELLAHAQIGHRSGVMTTLNAIEDAALIDGDVLKGFRDLSARMDYARLASTLDALLGGVAA
ncbi:MAG: ATP-binding protein [Pseudomonadota bacterium]|nr:ATP-binding protein [Pseudomonadota bacterium]